MAWGEHIELLERSQRQGNKTSLDDRPALYDDLQFYWNAFIDLSARRGMGSGIAVSEMVLYAEVTGAKNIRQFVELIMLIDDVYLKITRAKEDDGGRKNP